MRAATIAPPAPPPATITSGSRPTGLLGELRRRSELDSLADVRADEREEDADRGHDHIEKRREHAHRLALYEEEGRRNRDDEARDDRLDERAPRRDHADEQPADEPDGDADGHAVPPFEVEPGKDHRKSEHERRGQHALNGEGDEEPLHAHSFLLVAAL